MTFSDQTGEMERDGDPRLQSEMEIISGPVTSRKVSIRYRPKSKRKVN
jgi:hypothetical protein